MKVHHLENLSSDEYQQLVAMRTRPSQATDALTEEDLANLPDLMRQTGRSGPWDEPWWGDRASTARKNGLWYWLGEPYFSQKYPHLESRVRASREAERRWMSGEFRNLRRGESGPSVFQFKTTDAPEEIGWFDSTVMLEFAYGPPIELVPGLPEPNVWAD